MAYPDRIPTNNRLLANMSDADFGRLSPQMEHVELPRALALAAPGQIADYCYFIESGIGSIVLEFESGVQRAEIGIVGREGMVSTASVLNAPSAPFSIFMQVAGSGYRLNAGLLSSVMVESLTLRNLLTRYAQTMSVQTSYTALVNATQHVDQRLARWILMCHDRVDGDTIILTHEFLAIMLAVRRQSVTEALPLLEGTGLIKAERSRIRVLDRPGLIKFAGDSYGAPEAEYRRLMGF